MYGLVNEAIRGMVLAQFDEPTWEAIAAEAGVDDEFVAMHTYDDADTYALVTAAASRLGLPAEDILKGFGHHWIRYTAAEGYGSMVDLFGDTLEAFLISLGDNLHARVSAAMPELAPPDFTVERLASNHFQIGYSSHRAGLAPMVTGLLEGLAENYERKARVELLESFESNGVHQARFDMQLLD